MSDGLCLLHTRREVQTRADHGQSVLYVQGMVTNPYDNKTFMHAWAEIENEVIDPTIDLKISKEKYYSFFNPTNVIRVEEPIMELLCAKGDKFFTKNDVKKAYEHHYNYLHKKYYDKTANRTKKKSNPKKRTKKIIKKPKLKKK
jgi:hypothetical protein